MDKKQKFLRVLTGVFTGLANGFFGGGGGMILVPMLEKIMGYEEKKAHATAILIILPVSFVSALIQIINGNFKLWSGVYVSAGVLAGGILGAFLLKKTKNVTLNFIFSAVMLIAGVKLLFF